MRLTLDRDTKKANSYQLICQRDAYSILHLFLHDYNDAQIMSFCADLPFWSLMEQQIWEANRKSLAAYVGSNKDLKLIWERDGVTEPVIKMFEPFRDIGREESLTCFCGGKEKTFYVLTIESGKIGQLKERVRQLPESIL